MRKEIISPLKSLESITMNECPTQVYMVKGNEILEAGVKMLPLILTTQQFEPRLESNIDVIF